MSATTSKYVVISADCHGGASIEPERTVIDVPHLLALWSLGLIVWLLVLPWCVGFLWIVMDSLR